MGDGLPCSIKKEVCACVSVVVVVGVTRDFEG